MKQLTSVTATDLDVVLQETSSTILTVANTQTSN